MLQLFFISTLEELIYEALDLGVYNSKKYRIDGELTYVSFQFDNLSISGAYRDNKCVVLKIWLLEDNIKIPVLGGTDAIPTSRNWITNDKKLKKRTIEIIAEIRDEINVRKQQQSFKIQRAI